MKLVRFGEPRWEHPGLIGPDGEIRDLSNHIDDLKEGVLSPAGLERIAQIDINSLPIVDRSNLRLGPPVGRTPKYLAIGLNYADHAAETGMPVPSEPLIFSKATSCISGPDDPISLPEHATKVDYEVELAFVIGTRGTQISEEDAMDYVAGYCLANDVSERAWQKETSGQWIKGKSLDGFGPLGPWLVTKDEIPDPHNLSVYLDVNGERRQESNTNQLIFSIPQIISTITRYMTLEPGDVIATGTPSGVGWGKKPPIFLKAGDKIRLGIEGLGEQTQIIESSAK